jgi:preprotein translocase subunit SecG
LLVLILLSNFAIGGPADSAESKALNPDDTTTTVPITTPQSTSENTATPQDTTQN